MSPGPDLRDPSCSERFIGWDPANIEDIYQTAYRHRFYRGGEVLMSAISGSVSPPPLRSGPLTKLDYLASLDIALWDIKGKTLGVPVWELLGGKVRERANVYGQLAFSVPVPSALY
mgnify:FL=1